MLKERGLSPNTSTRSGRRSLVVWGKFESPTLIFHTTPLDLLSTSSERCCHSIVVYKGILKHSTISSAATLFTLRLPHQLTSIKQRFQSGAPTLSFGIQATKTCAIF
jgi:hypothetical protein